MGRRYCAFGLRLFGERFESQYLLAAIITEITADHGAFRYITSSGASDFPAVFETYHAKVSGSATRVTFALGGATLTDTIAAEGWSAQFNMSALQSDDDLIVSVYEGAQLAESESYSVKLIGLPQWMRRDSVELNTSFDWSSGYAFDVYVKDLD